MTGISPIASQLGSAERGADVSTAIVRSHERDRAAYNEAVDNILAAQLRWEEAVRASMQVYDLGRRGSFDTGAVAARLIAVA